VACIRWNASLPSSRRSTTRAERPSSAHGARTLAGRRPGRCGSCVAWRGSGGRDQPCSRAGVARVGSSDGLDGGVSMRLHRSCLQAVYSLSLHLLGGREVAFGHVNEPLTCSQTAEERPFLKCLPVNLAYGYCLRQKFECSLFLITQYVQCKAKLCSR